MIVKNKRFIGILLAIAFILIIPLIAMQFTDEVRWTLSDFAIAGSLLLGAGLAIEFVLRNVSKMDHKILISAAIILVLLLIWVELAVGIFGTPFAGN